MTVAESGLELWSLLRRSFSWFLYAQSRIFQSVFSNSSLYQFPCGTVGCVTLPTRLLLPDTTYVQALIGKWYEERSIPAADAETLERCNMYVNM